MLDQFGEVRKNRLSAFAGELNHFISTARLPTNPERSALSLIGVLDDLAVHARVEDDVTWADTLSRHSAEFLGEVKSTVEYANLISQLAADATVEAAQTERPA